jgi:hypothetical protein
MSESLSASLEKGLKINAQAPAPAEDHAKDRYGFLPSNFTCIQHEGNYGIGVLCVCMLTSNRSAMDGDV